MGCIMRVCLKECHVLIVYESICDIKKDMKYVQIEIGFVYRDTYCGIWREKLKLDMYLGV